MKHMKVNGTNQKVYFQEDLRWNQEKNAYRRPDRNVCLQKQAGRID